MTGPLWYEDMEDGPLPVRFEPCAVFRLPLSGDLMTCADCGYWIAEHQSDGA